MNKSLSLQIQYQSSKICIADLVQEGSTVAIAAEADPVYDFYLMRVTRKETLSEAVTDDYGSEHPPNTKILRGHFFLRENMLDMTYMMNEQKMSRKYAL